MMNKRPAGAAVCLAAAVWGLILWNGDVADYIGSVKSFAGQARHAFDAVPSAGSHSADPLRARIEAEAGKVNEPPVNAVVDRVWHAIPGYNGVEVDIDRTYAIMQQRPLDAPLELVLREIEPEIGLDDLGSHPIYRGNPNKRMVSFMINVAWGNEYIPAILATLKKADVKATFFLDGSWLSKNEALARTIAADGHELSNHAYSHPDMSALGRDAQYKQIARTEKLLQALGVQNRWFAPPSGAYNATTVKTAEQLGLKTVLWTVDTVDWKRPAPEAVVAKIGRQTGPGSLILMHPTASTRDALAGMIAAVRGRGLAIGTVSETLSSARTAPVER